MAETVKAFSYTNVGRDVVEVRWTGLDADDSGQAVDLSSYPDRTIQITGVMDGATTTLYWSNDTTAVKTDRAAGTLFGSKTAGWTVAQDSLGNNIAKTVTATGDQVLEAGHWFLPVNTGGGASTLVNVTITARRNRI